MSYKRLIENDVFDIAQRMKEIDSEYFILYDLQKRRYEVHSKRQRGDTLAFVVPYPSLDKRTLDFARETSIARREDLLQQIDRENKRREEDVSRRILDKAKEKTKNLARYLFSGKEDIPRYEEL